MRYLPKSYLFQIRSLSADRINENRPDIDTRIGAAKTIAQQFADTPATSVRQ
jgi:hypothetical protein